MPSAWWLTRPFGITEVTLRAGKLRLTAEAQYPGQRLAFQQRENLAAGSWSPTGTEGGIVETHGLMVTAEFPLGATPSVLPRRGRSALIR